MRGRRRTTFRPRGVARLMIRGRGKTGRAGESPTYSSRRWTHDRRTAGHGGIRRHPANEIEEFGMILGPLVALVSAATGFYYATRR